MYLYVGMNSEPVLTVNWVMALIALAALGFTGFGFVGAIMRLTWVVSEKLGEIQASINQSFQALSDRVLVIETHLGFRPPAKPT